jgi:hypothetical protein
MDAWQMLQFDVLSVRQYLAHAATLTEAVEHDTDPDRHEAAAGQAELPVGVAARRPVRQRRRSP